ncbi:MAG: CPBP family intramembrane metalloprotease [Gammaproteobacteria bacterium]|nr:CPBP family intramembrane metalloprotease [Gammaproteobacteria bacterium]
MISRGQTLRDRTLLFTGLVASLAGLALVALAAWWRQGRPALRGTARALDTPWPPGEGFGVLVRAGALGLAILAAASLFPSTLFKGNIVALWSTLFASLPMLWLIHRHLLKPRGLTFSSAFGLTLRRPGGVAGLLGVTVVVIALDQAGALAISWSAWQLGFQPHWWEGLQERWIWGPWDTTLLAGVNAVVWGPVFEEIGFRGLVYVSLRSRLRPVPAALISAGLFSLLHLYSLSGFLVVLWSGLIWAFVFERVRSLLPGMIAHAGGNMLALSTALLFYR